jgi:hypothetical protein
MITAITTAASAAAIGGSITTRTVAGPARRGKRVQAAVAGHNARVHSIVVVVAVIPAIQVVPALAAVAATWLLP